MTKKQILDLEGKEVLKSEQLVPKSGRLSLLSLLAEIMKMTTKGGTNLHAQKEEEEKVRSFLVTISKRYAWCILSYLFENGAITSVIARKRLSIPRRSAFRSLSELEEIGLVELAARAKVPHMDGKPGNVYRLIGADVEDVRKAVRLHNLLFGSRKYCIADDLAQTILEEFNEKGLKDPYYTFKEIRTRVKALKIPFSTYDISEMVYSILVDNGLSVWK